MEEYMKMLSEAKDSRLKEFMNQTDQFIDEIKGKINIQKQTVNGTKESSDDMEVKDKNKKDKFGSTNFYISANGKQEEIQDNQDILLSIILNK